MIQYTMVQMKIGAYIWILNYDIFKFQYFRVFSKLYSFLKIPHRIIRHVL